MTTHTVNTQTYVLKSGRESQKVARHQDRLVDCPSVAKSLGFCLKRVKKDIFLENISPHNI
jgi:hypothetical protein